MTTFKVQGGIKLKGELHPQGAKNEALQVLCAVLLTPEEVIIKNIPNILDVNILIDLLRDLNVNVKKISSTIYSFKADNINVEYLSSNEYKLKSSRIRGSIMIIGPLLARYGKGYIPKPGGDKIGRRRLDTHFIGFEKLGAKFEYDNNAITGLLPNLLTSLAVNKIISISSCSSGDLFIVVSEKNIGPSFDRAIYNPATFLTFFCNPITCKAGFNDSG